MENKKKRTYVILASIVNGWAFVVMLGFAILAFASGGPLKDYIFMIATLITSAVWVGAFTAKALRHCHEPEYPVVAVTLFAWPSFYVALFGVIYLLSFFGVNL